MEQFAVIKRIGAFSPMLADTFATREDAIAYAEIMSRKEDGWTYNVFENISVAK
jgi:hypothetical protein